MTRSLPFQKNKQKSFKSGPFETKICQILKAKKYLKYGVVVLVQTTYNG